MAKIVTYNAGSELSILDQTSSRYYNRLLYCFSLPEALSDKDTEALAQRFRYATTQIIDKWPFLACKIRLREPKEPAGEVELFWTQDEKPMPFDEHRWFSTDGVLRFKGVKGWGAKGAPSYHDLVVRGVPPSMLKDHKLCHVPHEPSLEDREGRPVYQITVNFTSGGLMLCVCFANSVIDSYAHGIIFEEFAKQVRAPQKQVKKMDKLVYQIQDRIRHIDMTALSGMTIDWTRVSCPELFPSTPRSLKRPVRPAGITLSSQSKSSSVTGRVFIFPMEVLEHQHQMLQKHIPTDTAGRPEATYQLGEILVAWLWASIVRARIRKDTVDTKRCQLAFSMNVRSQLGIPDGEKYLRNATLYNCAKLKTSAMLKDKGTAPGKILHRATRALHNQARSFHSEAVCNRLGYMSAICKYPGSLEYDVDTADENGVIVDWLIAPGRQADFGSAVIAGRNIELGQPQFVRELPGSDAPGRCAILPRSWGSSTPFEVYIQLEEDAMERLTKGLGEAGVHCTK